uniref:Uncharacterized protein n=2 Tax=Lotus japonicus TaxID=34305 RepID=I3TAK5_LOTJA|nr:unknown [Lotus japonicus]
MKSLGISYSTTSVALGCFLSSFLLSTVADITKKHSHQGWILDNLNISRLDYYYAFMVILSFLNFLCFLVTAKFFDYNVDVTHEKSGSELNPASLDNARICQGSESTAQPDAK